MIYLSTATSGQTITFIPRSFVINVRVEVKDEETLDVQTANVPLSELSSLAAVNIALNLKENKFYEFKVVSIGSNWDTVQQRWDLLTINWEQGITRSGAAWNFATNTWNETTGNWDAVRLPKEIVIYKDRIFCTNQTLSQGGNEYYELYKGVYKSSNARNNKYKVYDGPVT
jgi:hypothetical protein